MNRHNWIISQIKLMEGVILVESERNKDEIFKLYSQYADYFNDDHSNIIKPASVVKPKTIPKSVNKTCYNYYMISKAQTREASKDKSKSKQSIFKISKDNIDGEFRAGYDKNDCSKKHMRYKDLPKNNTLTKNASKRFYK